MDILKQFSAIETADGYNYAGTSNDVKPTNCMSGSIFKETDTGDFYIFDADTSSWTQILLAGGTSVKRPVRIEVGGSIHDEEHYFGYPIDTTGLSVFCRTADGGFYPLTYEAIGIYHPLDENGSPQKFNLNLKYDAASIPDETTRIANVPYAVNVKYYERMGAAATSNIMCTDVNVENDLMFNVMVYMPTSVTLDDNEIEIIEGDSLTVGKIESLGVSLVYSDGHTEENIEFARNRNGKIYYYDADGKYHESDILDVDIPSEDIGEYLMTIEIGGAKATFTAYGTSEDVPSVDIPYLEVAGLPESLSVPEGYPMDEGLFTTLPTVTLVCGNVRKTLTYSVSIPDYKSLEEVTHWTFEVPVRHRSSLPDEFVAIPCVRIVGDSGYTCLFSDERMSVDYMHQSVTFSIKNFAPPSVLNSPYKSTNVKCGFRSTGFTELSYSLRNICGIRVEFRTTSQSAASDPYKVKLITDTNSTIIDADDFLEGETQLTVKAGMMLYEHSVANVIAYLDIAGSYTTATTVTKGDIA